MDREVLARGDVMARARQRDGQAATVLSDEALLASRRAVIPDHFDGPLWVFGYGSLIWNPVIAFDQRIDALVQGYHRRFFVCGRQLDAARLIVQAWFWASTKAALPKDNCFVSHVTK